MADVITIPECGKNKLLELQLGLDNAEDLLLKLFVNDETVDADTVVGDFTEMSTHDYVAKTLTMATWLAPAVTSLQSISTYDQQTWTFAAGTLVNVYGYYVCMFSSPQTLLWVNKFGAAKPIQYAGEQISVTPELRLGV